VATKVVELNKEVIKRLLDEADFDRLDMTTWVRDAEGYARVDSFEAGRIVEDCGTAGCIAGWVCALYAPTATPLTIASAAAELLAVGRERPPHPRLRLD
jgi:hypothetical protein